MKQEFFREEYYASQIHQLAGDLLVDSPEYLDRRMKIKRYPKSDSILIDHLRRIGGEFFLFSTEIVSPKRLRFSEATSVNEFIEEFISKDPRFQLPDQDLDDAELADYNGYFYRNDPNIKDFNTSLQMFNFNVAEMDSHRLHVYVNLGYLISELQRRLVTKTSALENFRFKNCNASGQVLRAYDDESTSKEHLANFEAFVDTCRRFPLSMRGAEAEVGIAHPMVNLFKPYYRSDLSRVMRTLGQLDLLTPKSKIKSYLRLGSFPLREGLWFNKIGARLMVSCGSKTPWWCTDE